MLGLLITASATKRSICIRTNGILVFLCPLGHGWTPFYTGLRTPKMLICLEVWLLCRGIVYLDSLLPSQGWDEITARVNKKMTIIWMVTFTPRGEKSLGPQLPQIIVGKSEKEKPSHSSPFLGCLGPSPIQLGRMAPAVPLVLFFFIFFCSIFFQQLQIRNGGEDAEQPGGTIACLLSLTSLFMVGHFSIQKRPEMMQWVGGSSLP